jgi:hypothetical protein
MLNAADEKHWQENGWLWLQLPRRRRGAQLLA